MKRFPDNRTRLTWFADRLGLRIPEDLILDALDCIAQDEAADISYAAALYHWWSRVLTGYTVEAQLCQACGQSFINWAGRADMKYCGETCKKRAENTRLYYTHREQNITRAIRYQKFSKKGE